MIFSKTKKLFSFSFCPLLMLICSCGKKVESGSKSPERQRPNVTLSETIAMETTLKATALVDEETLSNEFSVPRNGFVTLPSSFPSNASGARPHRLRVYMNVDESGLEEFSCQWNYSDVLYTFKKCEDASGTDLGLTEANVDKFPFAIDQGRLLKLRIQNAGTGPELKARLDIPVSHWN